MVCIILNYVFIKLAHLKWLINGYSRSLLKIKFLVFDILNLKQLVLKSLDTNKALDIVSIDLENKSSMADYLVIASGTSSRHIQALSEMILMEFKKNGVQNCKIEGIESNDWKLIDGKDVVVHIFNKEKRKFFDLEKMWSELIPKEKLTI